VARSLRKHRPLLLNWFRAKGTISAGIIEGFNNKAKPTMRKSYGFRAYETIELALYYQLGNLPQPKFTHRPDQTNQPRPVKGHVAADPLTVKSCAL